MYLSEYCPLTKTALKSNPNIITMYKETIKKMFNSQLDDIGIYPVGIKICAELKKII